jgi:hypothetical protein
LSSVQYTYSEVNSFFNICSNTNQAVNVTLKEHHHQAEYKDLHYIHTYVTAKSKRYRPLMDSAGEILQGHAGDEGGGVYADPPAGSVCSIFSGPNQSVDHVNAGTCKNLKRRGSQNKQELKASCSQDTVGDSLLTLM